MTALDVANWFIASIDRDAGDSITPLKVQKLIYYAQAWSLALRGEELFTEDMQAWAHGPVAPTVYQEFKDFVWNSLPPPDESPEISDEVDEHLQSILHAYGTIGAKQLERMTHNEEPWIRARGDLPPEARSSSIISKDHMAEFYMQLHEKYGGE